MEKRDFKGHFYAESGPFKTTQLRTNFKVNANFEIVHFL